MIKRLQIYVIPAVVANLTTGKFAKDGHFTCIAIKKEYNVISMIKKASILKVVTVRMETLTSFYDVSSYLFLCVWLFPVFHSLHSFGCNNISSASLNFDACLMVFYRHDIG